MERSRSSIPSRPQRVCDDLPSNGVHGWLNLNDEGKMCSDNDSNFGCDANFPKLQVLAVDGRIAVGLLPELLIPHISSLEYYNKTIRPTVVKALTYILSFKAIQWLIGHTFGFLICDVNPTKRGLR